MPKSKRDKKISLTKTSKKDLGFKKQIVEDVRECIEKFNSVYVFTFGSMRNEKLKEIRQDWKPSRFFFGKNKVIGVGLGRNKEEEVAPGLHKITKCLKGQCALLFTNSPKDEVVGWFDTFECEGFARSGYEVDRTVKLEEGPLKQFPHSIEPYLRELGMPTKLDKGVVTLIKKYRVCKKGNVLTPEQAKILELLGYKLATFKLVLKAVWSKDEGFEKLKQEEEQPEEVDDKEDDVLEDMEEDS